MTAGLHALSHDRLRALTHGTDGDGCRSDDGHDDRAERLKALDHLAGAAGTRGEHLDAVLRSQLHCGGSRGRHEHDVHAVGLVREFADLDEFLFKKLGRGIPRSDDSQSSRVADRSGQFSVGDPGHRALDHRIFDSQQIC